MLYKIAQKAGFSFQKAMTDPSTFLLSYGTVEKFSVFPFSFEKSTNITSKTDTYKEGFERLPFHLHKTYGSSK